MWIVREHQYKSALSLEFTYSVSAGFERLSLLLVLVFSAQCLQVVILVGQWLIVQEKVFSCFASSCGHHVQFRDRNIRLDSL